MRKMTLGAVGKLTVEEARKLAKKTLGGVANGADPAARAGAKAVNPLTLLLDPSMGADHAPTET